MHKSLYVLVILVLLSACAPTPTPIVSYGPTNTVAPSATKTLTPSPTATTAATPIPTATSTATPRPTVTPTYPVFIHPGEEIPYITGFNFDGNLSDDLLMPVADQGLRALKDTGAGWVSLMVAAGRESNTDLNVYYDRYPWTASDQALRHAILEAHDLGLKVILRPTVVSNDGSEIFGAGLTKADWDVWFANYQQMLLHYAGLAQELHVEALSVGVRMFHEAQQENLWRAMLPEIRKVYEGLLVYSANHGDENSVKWWDQVDIIGIDAYYPLSEVVDPTAQQIANGWMPIVDDLTRLSAQYNRPIVFTEIGYTSQKQAAAQPWSDDLGELDVDLQARLYQAAFDALRDKEWFKGFLWYGWEITPYQGGLCNRAFTPKGKPAENILRAEFGSQPVDLDVVNLPALDENQVQRLQIFTDQIGPDASLPTQQSAWSLVEHPVYQGSNALMMPFEQDNRLNFAFNTPVDTSPYQWYEFYLYTENPDMLSQINIQAHGDNRLLYSQFLNTCSYFDGGEVQPKQWTLVRIPLEALNAENGSLQSLLWFFTEDGSEPFTVYFDQMSLVGLKP